jgi:hypothetical protein
MIRFWRLSEGGKRPWEEVFGLSLKNLEGRWLQSLEAFLNLLNRNPKDACSEAQRLVGASASGK